MKYQNSNCVSFVSGTDAIIVIKIMRWPV